MDFSAFVGVFIVIPLNLFCISGSVKRGTGRNVVEFLVNHIGLLGTRFLLEYE
jgi:hypothetical protein